MTPDFDSIRDPMCSTLGSLIRLLHLPLLRTPILRSVNFLDPARQTVLRSPCAAVDSPTRSVA